MRPPRRGLKAGFKPVVVPLAGRFRLGSVLGYLAAGVLIGPFGLRGAFLIFGCVAVLAFLIVLTRQIPRLESTDESGRLSFELLRIRGVRAAVIASVAPGPQMSSRVIVLAMAV